MLIEQEKIARLQSERPVFDFFRLVEKDASLVAWEQRDSYTGLQQVRGLGGNPSKVRAVGGKRFNMEPGVYGEFRNIDEIEMTNRRQWGNPNAPINIEDLVIEASEFLQVRFLDRVEYIAWQAIQGSFQILDAQGRILHQDAYTPQTYTALYPWSNALQSTPIGNYRDIQLMSRGKSTSFGSDAKSYMNRKTFNNLIANINNADLYGKRTTGLANVMTADQVNMVLAGEGLPQIVIYDQGYLMDPTPGTPPSAANFAPFIPDGMVIVVGTRPGSAPVGQYIMTRNVNNLGGGPGQYTKVIDRGENQVPRTVEVHNGHNGGPTLLYPGSVVIMRV